MVCQMPGVHLHRFNGGPCFALELEHFIPTRSVTADQINSEMVALVAALEGHTGARLALQLLATPDPQRPLLGRFEVHLIGTVDADVSDDRADVILEAVKEDVIDLLSAPPHRWSFRVVRDPAEFGRIMRPFLAADLAEIVRREEECEPVSWSRSLGFGANQAPPVADRPIWSMWTLGPPSADLRRLVHVMLGQSDPVAVRVMLHATSLTGEERLAIEQLAFDVQTSIAQSGLQAASLSTLRSLLYVRPLFEVQCIVASSTRLSRSLVSAIGHSISDAADPGAQHAVLTGGFAVIREGADAPDGTLHQAFDSWFPAIEHLSMAPPPLGRLRRLLGAREASNVFRIPTVDDDALPGADVLDLPDLPVPEGELPPSGLRLGRLIGHEGLGVHLEHEDRFRHLYVSGQTGTGKSSLLLNMALQDMNEGAGVAVLDPHGDLIESLLASIPDHRLDDVVLIDPADDQAVVGVNLLEAESDIQRSYLVSELCGMFQAMFDPRRQGIVGPRYESMLRGAAGLLLAHPDQPSSMLDIPTVFADTSVREHLLAGVRDPILTEYWQGEVAQNRSNEFGEVVSWFRSKFEVFRTSSLVRNVIGQATSTVSFNEVLNTQKILLVNLSKGLLGQYNSALLGQVVFMKLWGAALERAALPRTERRPFFMYIDEFQNMTTDSLPDVLSEARKFGVGLVLANQFFGQVPETTRDAIMGNVGSRVTFRLGPRDAGPFAAWMGNDVVSEDLITLPNFHAVVSLSRSGVPLDPFVMRSDPPASPVSDVRANEARSRSRAQWARPVAGLDDEFFSRWAHVPGSFAAKAANGSTGSTPAAAGPTTRPKPSLVDEWLAKRKTEIPQPTADPTDDEGEDT